MSYEEAESPFAIRTAADESRRADRGERHPPIARDPNDPESKMSND
jgi:hypothetical protein